jgi:hypothetical protein
VEEKRVTQKKGYSFFLRGVACGGKIRLVEKEIVKYHNKKDKG